MSFSSHGLLAFREKQQSLIAYLEAINGRLGAEETIQKVHVTVRSQIFLYLLIVRILIWVGF